MMLVMVLHIFRRHRERFISYQYLNYKLHELPGSILAISYSIGWFSKFCTVSMLQLVFRSADPVRIIKLSYYVSRIVPNHLKHF